MPQRTPRPISPFPQIFNHLPFPPSLSLPVCPSVCQSIIHSSLTSFQTFLLFQSRIVVNPLLIRFESGVSDHPHKRQSVTNPPFLNKSFNRDPRPLSLVRPYAAQSFVQRILSVSRSSLSISTCHFSVSCNSCWSVLRLGIV